MNRTASRLSTVLISTSLRVVRLATSVGEGFKDSGRLTSDDVNEMVSPQSVVCVSGFAGISLVDSIILYVLGVISNSNLVIFAVLPSCLMPVANLVSACA